MKLVLSLGLMFAVLITSAQRFDFTQFSTPEGLTQPGVYDLVSDSTGYLWIATENGGLLKFDGSKFEAIGTEQGLAEESVRVLYSDYENRIWFGTESAGLGCIEMGKIKLYTTAEGLPTLHYRAITGNSKSEIFVGSLDGRVFRLKENKWNELSIPDSLGISSVRAAVTDSSENIWLATDKGILRFKNEVWHFFNAQNGLIDPDVLCLYYEDKSGLWAGTQTGAYLFEDNAWSQLVHPKLTGRRIRSISADALGALWLGSNNGLLRLVFSGDSIITSQLFNENSGLGNNRIRKVYRDHSNTMWFGTYFGGISKDCDLTVSKYDARSGWTDNIITAIEESPDGTVFFGSFEGNVYEYQNQTAQVVFSDNNGLENRINDLLFFDNQLWIASAGNGLIVLDENRNRSAIDNTEPADGLIVFNSRIPLVWSGSELIDLNSKKRYSFDGFHNGYSDAVIWNDLLVLAGVDGVLMLDTNFSELPVIAQLRKEQINDLHVDPSGNLWLATQFKGLLRYDGNNVESFKSKSYLPDPRIKAICTDDHYNVWIATAKGLVRWEMDPEYQVVLDQEFFDRYESLRNAVCVENALHFGFDESVWLGTLGGFFRLNPGEDFVDYTAPELFLEGIDLRYEPIGWDTLGFKTDENHVPLNPVFYHTQNHLTFRWTAVEAGNEQEVMFEYRLLGLDSTWSWPRTEPYVTFTSLPPGEYELQVRAKSRSDFWSEKVLSYKFKIATPWYKKVWVIITGVLVLAGITWLFFRFRLMMLRRENLRLEQKVQERTFELEAEKQKSDELLLNILPEETAEELKREGIAKSRKYKEVSVLFSDFKGFTQLTESMSSKDLVASLDECFRAFDKHTSAFKVEKIKTIGDAYMCATGLPQEDPEHAVNMVKFALVMIQEMEKINARRENNGEPVWPIRIGIHSGPVVAGVVGEKKFAFDIWGDTVNIASRMESSGKPGKINISSATYSLVKSDFECKARGKVEAKNKGELEMYFIRSPKKKEI